MLNDSWSDDGGEYEVIKGGKMKKAILIMVLIFVLMGCAAQGNVPVMPNYETQVERACARTCQDIYSRCSPACGHFNDSWLFGKQKRCLDNCNQVLKDCYSSCEKAPTIQEKKDI
jgi:hypothetical protein